jgi:hypothetical protein
VIEGMALGIGTNAEQTVILIIALASHKWIEAFAFSTSFVKEGVPVRRWIGILLMYSLMTPLGITGGIFLSDYLSGDNAILAEVRHHRRWPFSYCHLLVPVWSHHSTCPGAHGVAGRRFVPVRLAGGHHL